MLVDLFFILSGYFTVQHFAKQKAKESPERRGRIALKCTAKKIWATLVFVGIIDCDALYL